MFTDWAALESAAAWELVEGATELELELELKSDFLISENHGAPAVWDLLEQRADAELEHRQWAYVGPANAFAAGAWGFLRPEQVAAAPPIGPCPIAALRAEQGKSVQLGLFEAANSPAVAVAPAIDHFNGPCVVCGEPGRRRNTMPAAIAAIMPPLEPTCEGHELVCDWGIPLSADQASELLSGRLPGVPTFRYRTVRGSKAAAAAKPKPKAVKPAKRKAAACP